jgi:hypothetical protein
MKNLRRNCTATEFLARVALCCALLLAGGGAWAGQVVGVVAHLSGPLMDRKADGTVKVLGPKSEVESGDTLVSEKNTYAQIRFIDNSEITLRPGTTFRIENFAYEADKPEGDSAAFSLVKGGLRSLTGLLGKRNKEKFSLKTPTATIGIRGTTFIAQWVDAPALDAGLPPATPATELAPGLHVAVLDGMIVVTNAGGAQDFPAGQFGYVPSVHQAPVIVPPHPALQFVPPPSFGGEGGGPLASQALEAKHNIVDCIVR